MHTPPSLLAGGLLVLLSAAPAPQLPHDEQGACRAARLRAPIVRSATVAGPHTLAVLYVLPAGIPYEEAVHQRLIEAAHDMRAWYQCASGGLTWAFAFPEVVRVHNALQTREYYRDHGDWWGSLLGEMGENGQPIWSPGTVTAIWARGAGWWAGAAQGCLGECGVALVGVEVFPEFNDPAWSGGDCPSATGPAAWPCTPVGAFAHELGHTVGLPHPFDVPETSADAPHSIMQTHWNYPDFAAGDESPWGFLTLERQTLLRNPFMLADIDLPQPHDCDLVNVPPAGPAPTAAFQLSSEALSIAATNTSSGAFLNYWTFGDGHVSGSADAAHTYDAPGTYTVTLRTVAENGMMALSRVDAEVRACAPLASRLEAWPPAGTRPARFRLSAPLQVLPGEALDPAAETVSLAIGDLVVDIPAGSFRRIQRRWHFSGTVGGLAVSSWLQGLGGTRYLFTLDAQGTAAAGVVPTAPVSLQIGTRAWCAR